LSPEPPSLPPTPAAFVAHDPGSPAPGDIYPRTNKERELCARASHPDWVYLGALGALDAGAILFSSLDAVNVQGWGSYPSLVGPLVLGTAWGATVGGFWLALPKCSPTWIGEPAVEGNVRANWPLAISLALLAGATAPMVNGIVAGTNDPPQWSNWERVLHVVVGGVAGFGGAFLPYLVPPRTWSAAQELDRIRVGVDARGSVFFGYSF
jgi:hypothetical protein